jgi:uncharacterized protein (DUF433 family)
VKGASTFNDSQDIYGGRDPAQIPSYTIGEAARLVNVALSTTRAWIIGQSNFPPVVEIADPRSRTLSFQNLVELHVLAATRRQHSISLQRVRQAVEFMTERLHVKHPLASQKMLTDGRDILIEWFGQYLNISQRGQGEMRQLLEAYLSRIEHKAGVPIRLYPFSRKAVLEDPRSIVIDPRVQFGRPCLAGTGVPTAAIAERYKAGESIESLASDYGRPRDHVEEAIRYEFPLAA